MSNDDKKGQGDIILSGRGAGKTTVALAQAWAEIERFKAKVRSCRDLLMVDDEDSEGECFWCGASWEPGAVEPDPGEEWHADDCPLKGGE